MATVLGDLIWRITGVTTDFDKALKKSETGLKGFGRGIGKFAAVAGGALAAIGVGRLSEELIQAASDAEETANKFNVVFRGLGTEAAAATDELTSSFGLSQRAAQGLLSDTADLLQGFGITKEESLALSTEVNQLAVDLASFTNFTGGAEGASEALTKALLGERESVKQLGIAITDAELRRFAEEQGLVFEELDKGERAFLTFELAVRQSQNAIGDFARSEQSFANQSRIAQANLDNLAVAFGESLLPLANVGVQQFNRLAVSLTVAAGQLKSFVTSAEGAALIGEILGTISGSLAVIGESAVIFLEPLGESLGTIFTALSEISLGAVNGAIAFDILGGALQLAGAGFRILTVLIVGNIEALVSFVEAIKETGALIGDFFGLITGQVRPAEFKEQLAATGDAFKVFGEDVVDSVAGTIDQVNEEFENFGAGAERNSERLAETFEGAFQSTAATVTGALLSAGETGADAAGSAAQGVVDVLDDAYGQLEEDTKETAENIGKTFEKEFRRTSGLASDFFGAIADISEAQGDRELADLQRRIDATEEGTAERIRLEQEFDQRSRQLQRESAQRQKTLGIFNAGISTAEAIIGFLADPGGIPGVILSGAAAAIGAAQVAAISSQPLPALQMGGIIPGNSRSGDKVLARVNSGEMVLNPEQQSRLFDIANGAGGGQDIRLFIDGVQVTNVVVERINRGEALIDARRGIK